MTSLQFLSKGLTLRHLRLIVALDEYRQVSRVAQVMHITQPAVSKALAELEEGLGYALFLRLPRGIEPTAHGMSFVRHATSILDELDRARDELLALGAGASETLSVGAMTGSTFSLMPQIVAKMRERMPRLNIAVYEASMETLMAQLRTNRLDVVLGGFSAAHEASDIVSHHLCDEVMRVVVAPQHRLTRMAALSWPDLQAHVWVVPPRTARLRGMLESALARHGIELPAHCVESVATGFVLGALMELQAVAFVSSRLARVYARHGLVQTLPLDVPDVMLRLRVLEMQGRTPTRAVELFRQCASSVAAG
jgi:DNA-binding transcriptional LysR family regulator